MQKSLQNNFGPKYVAPSSNNALILVDSPAQNITNVQDSTLHASDVEIPHADIDHDHTYVHARSEEVNIVRDQNLDIHAMHAHASIMHDGGNTIMGQIKTHAKMVGRPYLT